jgi:hypothetical protein
MGQACGVGATAPVLPKSPRAACMTAETGFQLAKVRSGPGRLSSGTNVLATKVSGKITMNEAPCTASGVGASRPTHANTHEIA